MVDISVIVPIYGVERHIERSLRSLFTQSKTQGVEFILVNDCTLDSSMEIAKGVISHFPELEVRIVEHAKNRGLAAARQSGMDVAVAEYVLHIDSDDWCEPTMIEDLWICAKDGHHDIVVADFWVDYHTFNTYSKQSPPSSGRESVEALLRGKLYGSVWNKLFRRSIFTENNLRWVEGISLWEDLLICSKAFCYAGSVGYVPKAYVHYMQNEGSICAVASPSKLRDVVAVIDNLDSFYRERGFMEIYNDALECKRLQAKYFLIRYSEGAQRKAFTKIYSTSDHKIMKFQDMSLDRRVALRAASMGHIWIFRLITSTRDRLRSISNTLKTKGYGK